jgi:Polysaccharide biosynthesis enzyme WcbI
VTSNCITGGLAQALQLLLPDYRVTADPLPRIDAERLDRNLKTSQFWVTSSPGLSEQLSVECPDNVKVIGFPTIYFDAFHPDIVYASSLDGTWITSATGPYNSAICLWAWQQRFDLGQTVRLFREEVFQVLGYHDRWDVSTRVLSERFSKFPELDFSKFFRSLSRSGVFMHTVNHPKVTAIVELARQIAPLIDPTREVEDLPIESVMIDGLFATSVSWMPYPSVADAMGLAGGFRWKLEDHSVIGLEDFVERSFVEYAKQDLRNISCKRLENPDFDGSLNAASER